MNPTPMSGHAEVAGLLAVVAGEHAETARVDGQRLVQRELGREVRDRLALQVRGTCSDHHVFRAARASSSLAIACVVAPQPGGVLRGAFEASPRHHPQHADGVVRRRTPQRVVEAAEHQPGFDVPTPPEIDREFGQSRDALPGVAADQRIVPSIGLRQNL